MADIREDELDDTQTIGMTAKERSEYASKKRYGSNSKTKASRLQASAERLRKNDEDAYDDRYDQYKHNLGKHPLLFN